MGKTLIIAEAGVNHNGDIGMARELVDVAKEAGADFVKFQTFKAEKLVSRTAAKAQYQLEATGNSSTTQFEMLKSLELNENSHRMLIDYSRTKGIDFLSAPFDLESVALLTDLGLTTLKIPSGELTNLPLLRLVASSVERIILSTGMATMEEIGDALDAITSNGFDKSHVTVLHCNTEYPTPMNDVNLMAMKSIAMTYGVRVGYSDHTIGIEVPIAAVALGATVIEKHFTLDRTLPGPDHKASLNPKELQSMVSAIRNIELALGTGVKKPTLSEEKNIEVARKSIHLAVAKSAGTLIESDDLIMLRPGNGISPMKYESLIGRVLIKHLQQGHKLSWEDIAK